MTAKKYRKTAAIEAEQFDGSKEMSKKYGIRLMPKSLEAGYLNTLEGTLVIHTGDWIATGVNGEHWSIADDIFRKTYVEVSK